MTGSILLGVWDTDEVSLFTLRMFWPLLTGRFGF